MSLAALPRAPAQETFSEFPMSPTRLILSASFFKQHQKFFVSRRPEQRRFRDPAPVQDRFPRDKLLQLAQHPLMNRRVGDDSLTFIHLGLARFELRFDERDDVT